MSSFSKLSPSCKKVHSQSHIYIYIDTEIPFEKAIMNEIKRGVDEDYSHGFRVGYIKEVSSVGL